MAPRLSSQTNQEDEVVTKDIIEDEKDEKVNYLKDRQKYKCFLGEFETTIIWTNFISILLIHFLFIYACVAVPWYKRPALVFYTLLTIIIGGFGVTGGVHRYWTHHSFKATLPLKIILLFCYSVAGMNNVLEWVKDHRVHHKFSETDADPHNANRGFLFSHVGWLCMKKHPEVLRKGKQIDTSDILADPIVAFHVRNWGWIKLVCCFILPAIPPVLWGESLLESVYAAVIIRWILTLHFTWSVNSVAHMWGYKPYNKDIMPTENRVVSVLTGGEGWHNYHHTFPSDYRAAEWNHYVDLTSMLLDFFSQIGWAYDLQTTSSDSIANIAANRGDGTRPCKEA